MTASAGLPEAGAEVGAKAGANDSVARVDRAIGKLGGTDLFVGSGLDIDALTALAGFAVGLAPESIVDGVTEMIGTIGDAGDLVDGLAGGGHLAALEGLAEGRITSSLTTAVEEQEQHDAASGEAAASACSCARTMERVSTECADKVEQAVDEATAVAEALVAVSGGLPRPINSQPFADGLREMARKVLLHAGQNVTEQLQRRNSSLEECADTLIAQSRPAAEPGNCGTSLCSPPTAPPETSVAAVGPCPALPVPTPQVECPPGGDRAGGAGILPASATPAAATVPCAVPDLPVAVAPSAVVPPPSGIPTEVLSVVGNVVGGVGAAAGAVVEQVAGVLQDAVQNAVNVALPEAGGGGCEPQGEPQCPPPEPEPGCGCSPEPEPEPASDEPCEPGPEPAPEPAPEPEPEPGPVSTVDPVHGFDKAPYLAAQSEEMSEPDPGADYTVQPPDPEPDPSPSALDAPDPPPAAPENSWDADIWLNSADETDIVVQRSGDW
jgi:hypothetical protein